MSRPPTIAATRVANPTSRSDRHAELEERQAVPDEPLHALGQQLVRTHRGDRLDRVGHLGQPGDQQHAAEHESRGGADPVEHDRPPIVRCRSTASDSGRFVSWPCRSCREQSEVVSQVGDRRPLGPQHRRSVGAEPDHVCSVRDLVRSARLVRPRRPCRTRPASGTAAFLIVGIGPVSPTYEAKLNVARYVVIASGVSRSGSVVMKTTWTLLPRGRRRACSVRPRSRAARCCTRRGNSCTRRRSTSPAPSCRRRGRTADRRCP